MIAKNFYYVCVKKVLILVRTEPTLIVSKASSITTTLSNLVTSPHKKISLQMPEKYACRVRILLFAKRKKTHAYIRMLKYACSVKGSIKQTKENKNFILICVFYIRISVFFCANA